MANFYAGPCVLSATLGYIKIWIYSYEKHLKPLKFDLKFYDKDLEIQMYTITYLNDKRRFWTILVHGNSTFVTFIDLHKTFDTAEHDVNYKAAKTESFIT